MNQLSNTKHNKEEQNMDRSHISFHQCWHWPQFPRCCRIRSLSLEFHSAKRWSVIPVISNSSVLLSWTNWALVAVASHVARRGSSRPPVNQEGTRWQATAWLVKILFLEEFLSILPNMPWLMSVQILGRRVEEGEGNGEDQNCLHVK